MAEFQSFDSFDEMMNHLQRADEAAQAQITDEQRRVLEDDKNPHYWVRVDYDFPIYGRVWTAQELDASSRRGTDDEDEIKWENDAAAERRARGYLFGTAYSVVCPEGELGSTHVIQVQPISKEMFEAAQANNWKEI